MADAYDLTGKSAYVAGHAGMAGQAIVRVLDHAGCRVLTAPRTLDLREQTKVREWFADNRPEVVIIAAARAGGIMAHRERPAEFAYDNVMIAANLIDTAARHAVERLVFVASSAIYPRGAAQPIKESAFLQGAPDPGHLGYAIAKIAGATLCDTYRAQYGCDFMTAVPTNLYGPGDRYDPVKSHVVPALIRKAHEAKIAGNEAMTIWGTGTPRRELLFVDDFAEACAHLVKHGQGGGLFNVGTGEDIAIRDLAALVAETVGFRGKIVTDPAKPDGAQGKRIDSTRLRATGWRPKTDLRSGLAATYRDFLSRGDGGVAA
ncbi:GDP-L-fucose synthase family protein [Croceicoccus naphthovorans]|uniref:GDP-L-fucose synthase n=1 Tax=Croceicoccus naphthovorans TaxID=1348774 RepID=A0A0G3XI93_9SPHN|nr:GDP-L-fucose synthase [Croceicoccus naphthovorans]AKM11290.1 GDP-L-fucose synthase [Croceicoccus naphthovorans]MBB3989788.1 GDP-L-fucose synthase [Croceicoccus naphthovorans]